MPRVTAAESRILGPLQQTQDVKVSTLMRRAAREGYTVQLTLKKKES